MITLFRNISVSDFMPISPIRLFPRWSEVSVYIRQSNARKKDEAEVRISVLFCSASHKYCIPLSPISFPSR